jgi:protein-disulfide isomerase
VKLTVRVLAAACAFWVAGVSLVAAQQPQTQKPAAQQPAATNQDIEALKRQIQALIAGQIAVQKQLDEIKGMLKAGVAAPAPAAPAPAPAIATVDTVIETAGAAVKGSPTAKVAIVEFSDYECPFCGRHAQQTIPQLTRDYVDSGMVRYIFKNLPLESIHPNAFQAAVAAECAGEQDKYWPMHDQLFANQRALDAASLVHHGRTAGLDVARFQQCVGSGKHDARIRQDLTEAGGVGATSTPSFFIAVVTPGDTKVRAVRMIRGAHPFATFKTAIDDVLAGK